MTQPERVFRRGPLPSRVRLLEVRRVHRLTPHMVRVTLGGEDLAGFNSEGADDHVKLFFPDEGVRMPVLPVLGPNGMGFPEGKPVPASRDYTPRRYDAAAGELDLDFVVHGTGPASNWASKAKPGDLIGVGGPRNSLIVASDFDWYLLAGDEAAIPSIGRRLGELPAGARALVFIEVADALEEQRFESRARVELKWLHRGGAEAGTTNLLEKALRGLELPPGDGFSWVAGESTVLRPIREHLLTERGLNKSWTRIIAYWKRGIADHHEPKG